MVLLRPLLLPALLVAATSAQDPVDPPKKREVEALIDSYVDLDLKTEVGRKAADVILARLARFPWPARESDLKRWQKLVDKQLSKQRELETKGGMQWYWDEPKRGKYYVGGQKRRPKGLFIGLHGGGAGSGDAGSAHGSYANAIDEYDWVGVFPEVLQKTEHGWTDSGTEEWVMTLVDEALRTFDIDPNRVVLGGHSMGGYGTWTLGAHHADRFAALVPSAGAPTPVTGPSGKYEDVVEGVVPNLRNVPMCVFQSTDDPQVPPEANQAAAAAVARAKERFGGYEQFEYWEVSGRGHGFPEEGVDALLAKVAAYERDPHPTTVVWQPVLDWKRQFYWLWWDAPERNAIVVAKLDREANAIDVELTKTDGAGLSVLLSQDLVDMTQPVVVRVAGEVVFEGVPEPRFDVWLHTSALGDPGRLYVAQVPLVP